MHDYHNEAAASVWTNKRAYDMAEARFFGGDKSAVPAQTNSKGGQTSLAKQISEIRAVVRNGRDRVPGGGAASEVSCEVLNRITQLEGENVALHSLVNSLETKLTEVFARLQEVENTVHKTNGVPKIQKDSEPKVVEEDDDDDDDVDLFGSDDEEEDAEAARIREERLKAYAEKKSKKVGPIAKSSILLDVKPWDDETDLKQMEATIRTIHMDGLVWGAAKTVPLAFGIHKLSILCTVEDEKVSIDDLSEKIQADEDFVQSVDIAAFNKI